MNALIRKVIAASLHGKQVITQREFLVDELVHMAMERALIYNAKLINILNAGKYDDEKQ